MKLEPRLEFGLPGAEHMRRDLELVEYVKDAPATLPIRLYTWQPWAISLGRNQNPDHIDIDAVSSHKWDVVTRPTGGRAVLHADELTYAVAIPLTNGLTPSIVYSYIHEYLLRGLGTLVPELAFTMSGTNLQHHYANAGASAMSCFTSAARTEIQFKGRKVVGSAQRVIDGVVLQHGSILIGPAHEQIADVLKVTPDQGDALRSELRESAISLSQILGRPVRTEEVADAIVA